MTRPAVILLSGGLDSATVLAMARAEGLACHALSLRYGQRHAAELRAARHVASALGVVQHLVLDLDLTAFGGSALTTPTIDVPKGRGPEGESPTPSGIPVTYVPARNTILLSLALAWAEVLGAEDIFLGVNAIDYSGYPDCRPEFIEAFQHLACRATAATTGGRTIRIRAPLLHLGKADIIRQGLALGVDYSMTLSCYDPDGTGAACGECDACQLRRRGFAAAGATDPGPYQSRS